MPHRDRISPEDLARDRAFWADLLALNSRSNALPPHTAGGFRNRRFTIVRDAAWITLYRAISPSPRIGVFLRCTGPAGEAFFTMADRLRSEIEPRLEDRLGPGGQIGWGTQNHPGMTDIIATIDAALPWNDAAAGLHTAWLLRIGEVWWREFSSLGQIECG